MMRELPDRRSLSVPDRPFSAYCHVCWQCIYPLWIDTVDHGSVCPHGAKTLGECKPASAWEKGKAAILGYLAQAKEAGDARSKQGEEAGRG